MEYPQSPEFGCDMEDFNVDEYWKKQAEIYNKQTADEMKERLEELKKIADKQSYEYLINKYSKLIVETAGLEKGKIYHIPIRKNKKFIMDVLNNDNVYIRSYKYDYTNKILKEPKAMDNEEKLYRLIGLYREIKESEGKRELLKINTCNPDTKYSVSVLLDNKRFNSIDIDKKGNSKDYNRFSVYAYKYSDVYDKGNVPLMLMFYSYGMNDNKSDIYFVKKSRNVNKQEADNLTMFDYFPVMLDFYLDEYLCYLKTKCTSLKPKTKVKIKMLAGLGITFELEENINLDRMIVEKDMF